MMEHNSRLDRVIQVTIYMLRYSVLVYFLRDLVSQLVSGELASCIQIGRVQIELHLQMYFEASKRGRSLTI